VVAGYRIEGVLGSGGMGTVYLARHPTLPRNDALKVLSAELSLDQQFRARFIREADLAATLNHPNIVTVFNRGETEDGQLWIAMEYVDGTAANDLARANLTPNRITRIITDVARALDYAHARRVLHRDIKPGNFLVSAPGVPDQERVLLADFGIARALDDATTLTATGSLVFTAAYAAPEAIEGAQVDHRADIYSLGCSLFKLLTSHTPYEEVGSVPAMLMAHMMRPIPRPTEVMPGLPAAIDDVVARAMAKNPADRFATAGELAAATAAALTGQSPTTAPGGTTDTRAWTNPVPAHPSPHPTGPPSAPVRRPPPEPTMHTMAPGQPYPGGQFLPPGPPGVGPGGPPPRPPGRRRRRGLIVGAAALVAALVAVAAVLLVGHQHGGGLGPYAPQKLNGSYGTVDLSHRPMAIAALGPGDGDAVLSLGVQPVVLGGIPGKSPSWLASLLHSSPPVLATVDPAAVAAAKPDLIIDTGTIDRATYDKLTAIAPTLTRPIDNSQDWTWQAQLNWIATALGRSGSAKTLIDDASSQLVKIKSEHAVFGGKSITVVNFTGTASTVAARVSPPTNYLESLGFTYNTHFKRGPDSPPEVAVTTDSLFFHSQSTDVIVLCRTDPAAGGGGYNGLPTGFNGYTGVLIIVDDPATILALNTGGPAANSYLNDALVTKLGNQIH
jgi:eukaryotic-like serine/threonine-protein kinase